MKKPALALTCALVAGIGHAQSSVTLFGVMDVGITHVSGSIASRTGLSTGGANVSRLGFRGTEDLGGGLAAGFWLEAGMDINSGAGKSTGGGISFNRRATVSLSSAQWGELRLGRDDSASFLNVLIFDPFLTNGVGGNNALVMLGAPIQISNAVSYFLPQNLGGFYGQLQIAPGGQPSNASYAKAGDYWGVRGGWRNAATHVAVAAGNLRGATSPADDVRAYNAGLAHDFGIARPSLLWAREQKQGVRIDAVELGVVVPVGAGEIRAQASRYNTTPGTADWTKYALGYGYNLSKRTQVYAAIARVSNESGAQKAIAVQGLGGAVTALGASSSGAEIGVRHSF